MLENYVCKIFIEAITSNHDLLWLITWSISWVGWQIHSLSIHGGFHKINVILVHILKVFFTLYVTVCTRVMVVNEFGTRLAELLFVTKVLGTCTCTKKYLMPSKSCEYLYLYIWKVLVLDSSTAESTWPQPWLVSHYLSQCWPRTLSPYGVTRPQWVNNSHKSITVLSTQPRISSCLYFKSLQCGVTLKPLTIVVFSSVFSETAKETIIYHSIYCSS